MEYCRRYGVAIAIYLPLIAIISIGRQSDGRELRPSEHGLTYQFTPAVTGAKSPEMLSFFSGTAANISLPEARNASDSSWWSSGGGGVWRKDGGGDHVKRVLLVASLVCGITGVVLLVVAAFLFVIRFKKKRSSTSTLALRPIPST